MIIACGMIEARYLASLKPGEMACGTGEVFTKSDADRVVAQIRSGSILDGWERPIHYRSPGVTHTDFEVWSDGPNGIDDDGLGDDVLVGEDIAPIPSR